MKRSGNKGDARMARRLKRESDALQWQDVDATHTSAGARLTQLPPSLLRDRVFQFLAPLACVENTTSRRDGIDLDAFKKQLAPLRAMCQQWYKLAQFLLTEGSKSVCTISFETGNSTECARIIKRVTRAGGDHVQQLAVVTGQFIATWWESVLGQLPSIKRLDLTQLAAASRPAVLAAAAKQCPLIKELVLRMHPIDERPEPIQVLTDALRSWHTTSGGLRFLTIPMQPSTPVDYPSLLAGVAEHCPEIEYLERYEPNAHRTYNRVFFTAPIPFVSPIPIDVWKAFCRRCPKLRAFDWQFAPMTTQHLAAFAATPRPQLETLTMELSNSPTSWQGVSDLSPIMDVVAHAPALRCFELFLKSSSLVDSMPIRAMDDVAHQVASHCPCIEAFTSIDFRREGPAAPLSGDAIVALARQGSLRYLYVAYVTLSGDTLVHLLQGMQQTHPPKRVIDIAAAKHAHAAVVNLLTYLEQAPADRFADTTLEFYVNGQFTEDEVGSDPVPTTECKASRHHVTQLVESIKQKYAPWLSYIHVDVGTNKSDEKTVEMITRLDLLINVSEKRVDEGYDDENEDGTQSKRGGVFNARDWSGHMPERFAVWEQTTR